ncbi:hypothetical protein DT073_06145 [Microbacterium sp. ABRD28]|nr:hypothetical protein DT073_06145 [Microbacterium sp. ABRD28]
MSTRSAARPRPPQRPAPATATARPRAPSARGRRRTIRSSRSGGAPTRGTRSAPPACRAARLPERG